MINLNFTTYLLFVAGFLFAQPGAIAQTERVEERIHRIMDEHQVVGLSVVVVKDGEIVYSKPFGLKDIESGTPLGEADIFRIASISKSFSATSIMQLVQAGKVSLDDD